MASLARDRNYWCSSPDLWNFELAHAGIEEVSEPKFESRPIVEYKLREDGVKSRRISWLQTTEGSIKFFRPEGFGDTVTLRCWNLPYVKQLFLDKPGSLAAAGFVCTVLHELRADGIFRDEAQVRGVSRPASKFVDCSPCLAAIMQDVDGVDSFLPLLLLLLL